MSLWDRSREQNHKTTGNRDGFAEFGQECRSVSIRGRPVVFSDGLDAVSIFSKKRSKALLNVILARRYGLADAVVCRGDGFGVALIGEAPVYTAARIAGSLRA